MTKHWSPAALVFLVLAIVGLVVTWSYNIAAIVERRDFIGDLVSSGPAVSSITWDLLVVAVAGSLLMVLEARRLEMRFVWLYILGSGLTAFAFTFPLFLANRQRRLNALRAGDADAAAASGSDGRP